MEAACPSPLPLDVGSHSGPVLTVNCTKALETCSLICSEAVGDIKTISEVAEGENYPPLPKWLSIGRLKTLGKGWGEAGL